MFREAVDQPGPTQIEPEKSLFEAMMGMAAEEWDAIVAVERDLDDE